MSKELNADRYLTKRWPAGNAEIVYYIRPGGNDDNDGLTALTAFATLDRALHFMAIADVNTPITVDASTMTGANALTGNFVQQLGGTTLGGVSFDIDLAATSPNNFFSRAHRQIRAELMLDTALNVTAQAFDATSGILQLTVADALVANALRGKFAVGSVLGEYGVIQSNTGGAGPNTIEVANLVGLTAPVSAYGPGATLRFGDAANFFEQANYLLAMCDWNFQGLLIESNGPKAAAVSVWPNAPVHFTLCEIEGIELNEGSGTIYIDGCYVHDQDFIVDGATLSMNQSYLRGLDFLCHGSGASGLTEIIGNIFEANVSAFGGGNAESRFQYQMENCRVVSNINEGLYALFGNSRIVDTTIDNCGKDAIVAQDPQALLLNNVQGAGSVGYGCKATYGPNVRVVGGTAVTGTVNDVFVGAVGAAAWGATPITDGDQLVRIGV